MDPSNPVRNSNEPWEDEEKKEGKRDNDRQTEVGFDEQLKDGMSSR